MYAALYQSTAQSLFCFRAEMQRLSYTHSPEAAASLETDLPSTNPRLSTLQGIQTAPGEAPSPRWNPADPSGAAVGTSTHSATMAECHHTHRVPPSEVPRPCCFREHCPLLHQKQPRKGLGDELNSLDFVLLSHSFERTLQRMQC